MIEKEVTIIGAGLAGCEAALTLANFGHHVRLYEQKPINYTNVYHLPTYSELVCNNSLCPNDSKKPAALLVHELKVLHSCLIGFAEKSMILDSHYFSVDKKKFSAEVTSKIDSISNITVINEEIKSIPEADCLIIASGPLTNERLLRSVSKKYSINEFHFSDASSSVIDIKSIDLSNDRIIKLSNDLYMVKVPDTTLSSVTTMLQKFCEHREEDVAPLQECQSIEQLARQGKEVLNKTRFTHAGLGSNCLLLRRENGMEDGFIVAGSMTMLSHADQRRVFSILPGFSKVRFLKYGRMHRNTYFDSPGHLNPFYQIIGTNTYIVGQLSGIDGYVPAISSGLIAALHIQYQDQLMIPPTNTMIGALARFVSNPKVTAFQPIGPSFSLVFGGSDDEKIDEAKQSIEDYYKHVVSLSSIN